MEMPKLEVVKFASVVVVSILIGALLGGHLFTLITSEFPGPGPGFSQKVTIQVHSTTTINTQEPERFISGPLSIIPQLVTCYWSAAGQMIRELNGSYSILWSRHAGVLTNDGKDWLENQISGSPSAATIAKWIALTRDAHAPAATDEKLWAEIDTGGGLDKAAGTYSNTDVGTWTVTYQFTADAAYVAVQATGLHWTTTGSENNTMLCSDTFAPVTLANGDKVTITWSLSVA